MTGVVLDASMTIAWLFEDERTDAALDVLNQVIGQGARVPAIWTLEVANVLRNAARKGRCDEAFVDESLASLARLPIATDGETDLHAWAETLTLSREEGLTLYDSAYLELAVRNGLPLATGDRQLAAAAQRHAIMVLKP